MHISSSLAGASLLGGAMAAYSTPSWFSSIRDLSFGTTITVGEFDSRWSEYAAPAPGSIVKVGAEADVAKLVKAATAARVPFLVQSGANGWADTFKLGSNGAVFDVSGLKGITFNEDKTNVTIQTGVTNADIISAAWANNARVSASTCNCVSLMGATLGGGLSRIQGTYGHNVDNLLSINYVNAQGQEVTVTPTSDPDMWFAMTGAGANFGITTSVTYKSVPMAQEDNFAWTGLLFFDPSQLSDVINAIDQIVLEPDMQMDMYLAASPLTGEPAVLVLPFYLGTEDVGRQKFASILALGPNTDTTAIVPYNTWNAAGDGFCTKGGRKPAYSVGLKTMDAAAWQNVWNEFYNFYHAYPEANQTTILTECYPTSAGSVAAEAHPGTAYSHRDVKCHAIAIPWYTSESLDARANEMGCAIREQWRASAGTPEPETYINFAHGDETLQQIYGSNLARLQTLKRQQDPKGLFNQWFPLS